MSESSREIKRRITAIQNTRKVTHAMKLVAAMRFKRTHEETIDSRVYSDEIRAIAERVSRRIKGERSPLWEENGAAERYMLVISADRGLCGGLNDGLAKAVVKKIKEYKDKGINLKIYVVGKKGQFYLRAYGVASELVSSDDGLNGILEWASKMLMARYLSGEVGGVYIAYTKFINVMKNKSSFAQLLPTCSDVSGEIGGIEYLYEPSGAEVLEQLGRDLFKNSIRQAYMESLTSEYSARMTAMESSTSNADSMLLKLKMDLNRARQEEITGELLDIVGGAEALRKQRGS